MKVKPLIYGGGQQKDMRSGTENVPGIAGIGEAAREIYKNFDEKSERLYKLRDEFVEKLKAIDGVVINGFESRVLETGDEHLGIVGDDCFSKGQAPHVISASFENIRAEVLLHVALGEKCLCFVRFGMLIESSGNQRHVKGHRC